MDGRIESETICAVTEVFLGVDALRGGFRAGKPKSGSAFRFRTPHADGRREIQTQGNLPSGIAHPHVALMVGEIMAFQTSHRKIGSKFVVTIE